MDEKTTALLAEGAQLIRYSRLASQAAQDTIRSSREIIAGAHDAIQRSRATIARCEATAGRAAAAREAEASISNG
jgi:hypothetical protein